ncbi:MAG TPA: DUF885 domain-containing protein, partial [Pseudoxanthomonas sp.]|nr:DUF885 domain-containing protein [Pseudoxanthomonas sp.]
MFRSLLLASLLLAAVVPAYAQTSAQNPTLHKLFADEWERGLRESPENASYNGDPRFNDRWTDLSLPAIAARQEEDRAALEKLHAIDRKTLSAADQLDYDTFEWNLQRSIERQKFKEYQQPISHQGGPQTADGIAEVLPFATVKDYQDWLKRLQALPKTLDQIVVLMQEGVKAGNVPPRVLMQRVPAQIAGQVVDDPAKSAFYKPFLKFPDSIAQADRDKLQAEAKRVIARDVVPAYRKLQTYFNEEYLPRTRESIAATDLPDGKAYYDFLARYYTTTELTAEQIHAIGLKEVARIRAEMEKVKAQAGFKGSLAEFFAYLRSDPKFFHKTPDELLTAYRALSKRIDPELVKVFKTIPRLPYGVRPIPDNIA